jgi:hypothetical protein
LSIVPELVTKAAKAARFQEVDRSRDEIVVQSQTERTIGPVRTNGAIGEGWIADGEIEAHRQVGCARNRR